MKIIRFLGHSDSSRSGTVNPVKFTTVVRPLPRSQSVEPPREAASKRHREPNEEPRQAERKILKRGALGGDEDFRSRNVPEDRILWVRATGLDYLPSPVAAAERLARAGILHDYLIPEGGFIEGWAAVGNNGNAYEYTRSYRLVFTSAAAKTQFQRQTQNLRHELRREGLMVSDWEWRDDEPSEGPGGSYSRAAQRASEDASRAIELAYRGTEGFDGGAGSQSGFRSLNEKVAEARSYNSAVQRGGRGGGRFGRGSYSRGRGFGGFR